MILEAFAMARPLCSRQMPRCRHTVDDKVNGLICKVADEKDLFKKWRTLCCCHKRRNRLCILLPDRKAINAFNRYYCKRIFEPIDYP